VTTRLGLRRRMERCVLAVGLAFGASQAAASDCPAVSRDCPPVSRQRYRVLPDESAVAFAALMHHLGKHPPQGNDALCVSMPGYKALPKAYATRIATPSRRLDPDPNCRFQGGRQVIAAEGVWQLKDGRYVVDVRILKFDDISTSLALFRYTLARTAGVLSVQREVDCQR
jgi:hypothetical protein